MATLGDTTAKSLVLATPLSISNGGTGATTASGARTNIGLANAMLMGNANGYWGMGNPSGATDVWIRTTSQGILPYQSGGSSNGHQSLGTSSWYFANAYIDTVHGSLNGNAESATDSSYAAKIGTNASHPAIGGSSQPVYVANTGVVTAVSSVGPTYGGTGITSYTKGDILYASDNNVLSKLAKGVDGQVLKLSSGLPTWDTDNNTTYSSLVAKENGEDVSLVTNGEKYTWNNKANAFTVSSGNSTATWGGTVTVGTVKNVDLTFTMPANPNTHYTASLILGSADTSTTNTKTDTTNTTTYLNTVENSAKSGSIKIVGSGATTVKANNGVLTISSTDNNTWTANSTTAAGYVSAAGTPNRVYGVGATGNPTWLQVTNDMLANSSITIGSTTMSLGSTTTEIKDLTAISSSGDMVYFGVTGNIDADKDNNAITNTVNGQHNVMLTNFSGTSLYDGMKIHIRLSMSYDSNYNSLQIYNKNKVAVGTRQLIWHRYNQRTTSHLPQYAEADLTYRTNAGSFTTGTTAYVGMTASTTYTTGWVLNTQYQDGNDYANNSSDYYLLRKVGTNGVYGYNICTIDENNKLQSISLLNNDKKNSVETTTHEKNTAKFKIGEGFWYYAGSDKISENSVPGTSTLKHHQTLVDLRYSSNCGKTLTAYTPVYLIGIPDSDNPSLFTIGNVRNPKTNGDDDAGDLNWFTQTLPTTEDGKIYIYMGTTYSDADGYRISWNVFHPIYWFKNGMLQNYTVSNWSTLSGIPIVSGWSTETTYTNIPSEKLVKDTIADYLPLAGGTMTGSVLYPHNKASVKYRAVTGDDSYHTSFSYRTAGNEALVLGMAQSVTSFIVKCGLSKNKQISESSDMWYPINGKLGTPSIQVKNQSLYVNSGVATDVSPSYNFNVSGSANISGTLKVSNSDASSGATWSWDDTNKCLNLVFA